MKKTAIAALWLLVAVAGFACGTAPPLNIVVVTLDTTRTDRLSPYGNGDVSMPALERLAREGAVFDRAYTVVPLTLPAHTSLFTGLLPTAHGVRDNADPPLAPAVETLAEALQAVGYRTAAFVGSAVLQHDRGLAQGFDRYDDTTASGVTPAPAQRSGSAVVDDAIVWLEQTGNRPFFLWTHLYDAHQPYEPPEPFASRVADRYVAEIAFADAQLGRLLDAIDRRGVRDRTVVVVLGDHGEALGDRGERDHGIFLYDNVMQIPLLIRGPGVPVRRVAELAHITDVMPTILDLSAVPSRRVDGISLLPAIKGAAGRAEAYAESTYPKRLGWSPIYALRDRRYKLIAAPRPELYDLDADPFEQTNIAGKRASIVAAMQRRLEELTAVGRSVAAPVSQELRDRLAALGYASRGSAPTGALPDPKDCVALAAARLDEAAPIPGRVPCR